MKCKINLAELKIKNQKKLKFFAGFAYILLFTGLNSTKAGN